MKTCQKKRGALKASVGEEYEVERIFNHRLLSNGEIEYLVTFVGFDSDEWVHERDVNAPIALGMYWETHALPDAKDRKKKKRRKALPKLRPE